MAKVTIALSVYNVVEYVRASLDCIVNQTMPDIEILCIDDSSTDGTWGILQEYATRDERIRLWRMEQNSGLSVSRNKAIELAKSEYIVMLDGDDLFALDMVEQAYDKAKETGADMVLWDYCTFTREDELPAKIVQPSTLNLLDVNDKIALLRRPAFSPSRLLKMDAVKRLNIHFPEGLTKQDIPVHWRLVTSLDKIAVIPERLLRYRQQPGSTSNRHDRSLFSLAKVMDIVREDLHERLIYEEYRDEFLDLQLSLLHGMQDAIDPEFKVESMDLLRERYTEEARNYVESSTCRLPSRIRDYYRMLDGRFLPSLRYKGFKVLRAIYRRLKNEL